LLSRARSLPLYLRRHLNSSLYSNAYLILLAGLVPAASGYVFWAVIARVMSVEQVGVASALIAVTAFLTLLSGLDLGTLLIRHLPETTNKVALINTAIWLRVGLSAIASIIFLIGLSLWSPAQQFLNNSLLIAAAFVVANVLQSVNELALHFFVAYRRAGIGLNKNIYISLIRFPIVILAAMVLHGVDGLGVFLCVTLSTLIVLIYLFWKMLPAVEPKYRLRFEIVLSTVRGLLGYSAFNFLGELSLQVPLLLVPVIIANQLGNELSGIGYVVLMISGVVGQLPQGIARSLLSEGSHDLRQFRPNLLRALLLSFLLESVLIVGVLLTGRLLLSITFGPQYAARGTTFLILSTLSVLPMTVVYLYFSLQRIRGHIGQMALVGAIICVLTLGLIAILAPAHGLTGVGVGLLFGETIGAILTLPQIARSLQTPHHGPRQPIEYSSNHKTLALILSELFGAAHPDDIVLDIGRGSSSLLDVIRHAGGDSLRIVAVDVDAMALRAARRSQLQGENYYLYYNGYDLPLAPGSMNYIIAQELLEHVPDGHLFMRAIARVLKSGGHCLLTTPNSGRMARSAKSQSDRVKNYTAEELVNLAAESGLEVVDTFYRNHFFANVLDRLLLGVCPDSSSRFRFLALYEKGIDPFMTLIVQAEFKLMRNIPTGAQVFVLRKAVQTKI